MCVEPSVVELCRERGDGPQCNVVPETGGVEERDVVGNLKSRRVPDTTKDQSPTTTKVCSNTLGKTPQPPLPQPKPQRAHYHTLFGFNTAA